MYRTSPLRHIIPLLTGLSLTALALGACSSSVTTPSTALTSSEDCTKGSPQAVDGAAQPDERSKTMIVIVNAVPASRLSQVKHDTEQVLDAASQQGMTVVVTGPGMPPSAPLPLRGKGVVNPTERHQSRCQALQAEISAVNSALTNRATTPPAVFGPLKTASDSLASGGASSPDAVIVLGSAANAAGTPLTGEGLDQPLQFIEQLGAAGLFRRCDGTRFGFIVPQAAGADHGAAGYREFWRQYAHTCGGALVTWSDTVVPFGTNELPPAPTAPAPPISTPSPTQTPTPGTIVYTLPATTLFAINSAELTPAALDGMKAMLDDARTATSVTIRGYTDDLNVPGDPDSSLRLSQARADAVAAVVRIVLPAGATITAQGLGEADPVAPNTPATRHLNRRVVVSIARRTA